MLYMKPISFLPSGQGIHLTIGLTKVAVPRCRLVMCIHLMVCRFNIVPTEKLSAYILCAYSHELAVGLGSNEAVLTDCGLISCSKHLQAGKGYWCGNLIITFTQGQRKYWYRPCLKAVIGCWCCVGFRGRLGVMVHK